jgi:hypothetical protein
LSFKKKPPWLSFKLCPILILKHDFENKLEEFESSFEQDEIMDIKLWIFFHFSTILYIFSMFKNKIYKFGNKYVEATFEYWHVCNV